MKNNFDKVMDYIDDNIHKTTEAIKIGIHRVTGYNSRDFGRTFEMLVPDMSFYRYIITRKLYFAGKELYEEPDKSICEIALDFGYSEQSAFNRAMKKFFDCTPNELRKGLKKIPDDKRVLSDFCSESTHTGNRQNITFEQNEKGSFFMNDDHLDALDRASKEYGFDSNTCYAISEVAERLEIPVEVLIESCFDLAVEIHSLPDYLSPKDEKAIACGITSKEELEMVCEYFGCKYYDIDSFMVKAYRQQK